jgi:hypothetical protein
MSEGQRAMVAAKIAAPPVGANQHTIGSANLPTRKQAAEPLNVSDRTVRHARSVHDSGSPELARAVERGEAPSARQPRSSGRTRKVCFGV